MVGGGASTVTSPRAQPSAISITETFGVPIPVDTLSAPRVCLTHLRVAALSGIPTSELPCLTSIDLFPFCAFIHSRIAFLKYFPFVIA